MIGHVAGPGDLLLQARELAARHRDSVLVSWTEPLAPVDPLAIFHRAGSLVRQRAYWESPTGISVVGAGVCAALPPDPERTWHDLLDGALIGGEGSGVSGPILLGGLPFDPAKSPSQRWSAIAAPGLRVPAWQVTRSGDDYRLTINMLAAPGTDEASVERLLAGGRRLALAPALVAESVAPGTKRVQCGEPPGEWIQLVQRATAAIRRGDVEKVVLARTLQFPAPETEPVQVLARLRRRYPGCMLFAIADGDDCFLGATPERLVQMQDGEVQVDALAGTVRRGITPEEDRLLGDQLLASAKDRAEHAVVVRTVRETLADCCRDIVAPEAPVLRSLPNVQHLHTPLSGRLVTGEGILGLVRRLHPTPAVAGFPRSAAMRFLRDYEALDRGLYAGPVGWVDRHGEGEFAVALRSALLSGGEATLYAGCGIMADSDARREWEESCLKLQPMLSALGGRE